MRRKYQAWLWDAEYRDTLGVKVEGDGALQYSVFRQAQGQRAVIARVALEGGAHGALAAVTPEDLTERSSDGTLRIAPRSAAVLLER